MMVIVHALPAFCSFRIPWSFRAEALAYLINFAVSSSDAAGVSTNEMAPTDTSKDLELLAPKLDRAACVWANVDTMACIIFPYVAMVLVTSLLYFLLGGLLLCLFLYAAASSSAQLVTPWLHHDGPQAISKNLRAYGIVVPHQSHYSKKTWFPSG